MTLERGDPISTSKAFKSAYNFLVLVNRTNVSGSVMNTKSTLSLTSHFGFHGEAAMSPDPTRCRITSPPSEQASYIVLDPKGVAWRQTPTFNDRVASVAGPAFGEKLQGDIVQGALGDYYLHTARAKLPPTDVSSTDQPTAAPSTSGTAAPKTKWEVVSENGVLWRNSPNYADCNRNISGAHPGAILEGELVRADVVYLRITGEAGPQYLPLRSPNGMRLCDLLSSAAALLAGLRSCSTAGHPTAVAAAGQQPAFIETTRILLFDLQQAMLQLPKSQRQIMQRAIAALDAQISDLQRQPPSLPAFIEATKKLLFDLQQAMLQLPKSQQKMTKKAIAALDAQVSDLQGQLCSEMAPAASSDCLASEGETASIECCLNNDLFVLQQSMLQFPKSQRHPIKKQAVALDLQIAQLHSQPAAVRKEEAINNDGGGIFACCRGTRSRDVVEEFDEEGVSTSQPVNCSDRMCEEGPEKRPAFIEITKKQLFDLQQAMLQLPKSQRQIMKKAIAALDAQISDLQRQPPSLPAFIETTKKLLFDLQQAMLQLPKSQQKLMKKAIAALDAQVSDLQSQLCSEMAPDSSAASSDCLAMTTVNSAPLLNSERYYLPFYMPDNGGSRAIILGLAERVATFRVIAPDGAPDTVLE